MVFLSCSRRSHRGGGLYFGQFYLGGFGCVASASAGFAPKELTHGSATLEACDLVRSRIDRQLGKQNLVLPGVEAAKKNVRAGKALRPQQEPGLGRVNTAV